MKKIRNMANPLTQKYIAKNLFNARELCGKTIKECSLLLGIPTSRLKNYENGKYIPSLPELESLSFLLRVPLFAFFEENGITDLIHSPNSEQLIKLIAIRQQIIGTKIHIAREANNITIKEFAKTTSIPISRLKRYESGISSIPIDELIVIFEVLDLDPDEFFDHDSPIGEWQDFQSHISLIKVLPEDIIGFIANSKNLNFLKTAQTLSNIGVENFHSLSEAINDLVHSIDNSE